MKRWSRRGAWLVLAGTLLVAGAWLFCPQPTLYGSKGFSTAGYDREGDLLRLTLAPDDRYRLRTPLPRIAPTAVAATLLYEDAWFFRHPGFNPWSLLQAAWTTYVTRERVTGGSTVTMQLARLRFDIDSSSIGGKIMQILRALQLERHYGKRDILQAYLNLAPYGGNVEGIGTASLVYFGKPASALTLIEALTLAVIPQDPNARQPRSGLAPAELIAARQRLFARWRQAHPEDAGLAARVRLPVPVRGVDELPFRAPHFVRMVLRRHPRPGRLTTTLSPALQYLVERQVDRYIAAHRRQGIRNAAVLVVDTRDTSVRALVGSADWFNNAIDGQVNGVTAKRSPGSALKPFLYALALDQGLIHPMTLMKDAPARYGAWTPENFDQGFVGPVLAREALIYSRNVPAVTLAARLQQPDFYAFLKRAGVTGLRPREYYGLAIALGGVEITMVEMAQLYAALANAGVQHELAMLRSTAVRRPGRRLLSPEASFITLEMLAHNPRPNPPPAATGRDAYLPWKTGTSSGYRDAWSVGLVGPYVVAVWVGNFSGDGNPAFVGRRAAAPLLFSLIDTLVARNPSLARQQPSPNGLNVRRVAMCAPTGDLPNRHCPRTSPGWFIPGVSPIAVSTVYRAVHVDPETGLRLCPGAPGPGVTRVYEFWSSDLLALFRKAGLPRRTPPPFAAGCSLSRTAAFGTAPRIQTPQSTVTYTLRPDGLGEQRIPFRAVTDAGVRYLYWFVEGRFVGRSAADEPLLWKAEPGQFQVRAVDDLGRADTVGIRVRLLPQASTRGVAPGKQSPGATLSSNAG